MLLGVDVGGTFTDAVLVVGDRLHTAKAPSTPKDQSEGVMDAVTAALEAAGATPDDLEVFAHGMTVATNALLEGNGARTALVATEGFTDLVELGRQARRELYRLCATHPAPLLPPDRRFAAPERMGPDGVLRALDDGAATALADAVAGCEPEAVAVCLLHAYRHPQHEQRVRDALRERLGDDVHVSLSHETVGTFREYERAATTEVDAALSPLLAAYLRRLVDRTEDEGLPTPAIMQSSGGLADIGVAADHAAFTVLSGPAGGAAAAALLAARCDEPDLLCFDMGGTSCDVCVVEGGAVRESAGREVGGRPLALPMVDIHTVGAGGGSIGWRDAGGALRVGPRSAGAEPGPACYGRGGTEPTVTDANLVLGYLDQDSPLAGGVRLDRSAAERAVEKLGSDLGLSLEDAAAGIVRVANTGMAQAVRVVTVERGIDPRDLALVAFGGAGPLHAGAIAAELGMARVVAPVASGVLSALGLVVSERRRDLVESVLLSGEDFNRERIAEVVSRLGDRGREELGEPDAELRATYDLRYAGQAFELSVDGELEPDPEELRRAFDGAHAERYGYADEEAGLELVTVRVAAALPGEEPRPTEPDEAERRGTRKVRFGEEELDAEVLGQGRAEVEGPAIFELPGATLVVPPGW